MRLLFLISLLAAVNLNPSRELVGSFRGPAIIHRRCIILVNIACRCAQLQHQASTIIHRCNGLCYPFKIDDSIIGNQMNIPLSIIIVDMELSQPRTKLAAYTVCHQQKTPHALHPSKRLLPEIPPRQRPNWQGIAGFQRRLRRPFP